MVSTSPKVCKLANNELYVFYEYNNYSSYYRYDGNQWGNEGADSFTSIFSVSEANNDIFTVSTGASNLEMHQFDDIPAKPEALNSTSYYNHPKLYWNANNEPDIDNYKIFKDGNYLATTSNTYYVDNSEIVYTIGGGNIKTYASYKINAVDNSSNTSVFSDSKHVVINGITSAEKIAADEVIENVIETYELFSNYPNPFNPSTNISYQIPNDGFVNLVVYNALGQKVAELVNQEQTNGKYTVKFNASNLPSGVYIYKLNVSNGVEIGFSSTKKMILTK
jgi:hypothetical protein